jgi:hypothetical protein
MITWPSMMSENCEKIDRAVLILLFEYCRPDRMLCIAHHDLIDNHSFSSVTLSLASECRIDMEEFLLGTCCCTSSPVLSCPVNAVGNFESRNDSEELQLITGRYYQRPHDQFFDAFLQQIASMVRGDLFPNTEIPEDDVQ